LVTGQLLIGLGIDTGNKTAGQEVEQYPTITDGAENGPHAKKTVGVLVGETLFGQHNKKLRLGHVFEL
jgi:hypothetical protein